MSTTLKQPRNLTGTVGTNPYKISWYDEGSEVETALYAMADGIEEWLAYCQCVNCQEWRGRENKLER